MKKTVIPVLLGADMNCYGMARAFHEAYGAVSYVFGKCELGAVRYSKIIKFTKIPSIENGEAVLKILIDFSKKSDMKPFIFGCTDEYAVFVSENKEILSKYYVCKCPEADISKKYSEKDEFYKKCGELSIPYPKYICCESPEDVENKMSLPFDYPVIIKPSCSYKYWRHSFDGMKKVYSVIDFEQLKSEVNKIYLSGYDGKLILQEKICKGAEYVATCYSENGICRSICVGRVLLGEVTPKGIGNPVAIITENNELIAGYVSSFIKDIQYDGISNFDIIQDKKTGKPYLLEMNIRQGRSNYYMTASGMNISEMIVDGKFNLPIRKIFWHSIPKQIVLSKCDEKDADEIRILTKSGLSFSTFDYKYDLKNPARVAYLSAHNLRFFGKYKNYGRQ